METKFISQQRTSRAYVVAVQTSLTERLRDSSSNRRAGKDANLYCLGHFHIGGTDTMDHRNVITALAVAALIVLAVTTAGCLTNTASTPTSTPIPGSKATISNNTIYTSAAGFNITYPKTLKTQTSEDPTNQIRIYIYLAPNNTIDAVNVGTKDITASDTLADWLSYNINLVNDYPSYKALSNSSTTLDGVDAYTVVWQGTVPVQVGTASANVQNTTLEVMQTFVINNNTGYVVTYKALPSDYNTYLPQAEQIINSFSFTLTS